MSGGLFGYVSSAPAACSGSGNNRLGSWNVSSDPAAWWCPATSICMTDRKTTKYQPEFGLKIKKSTILVFCKFIFKANVQGQSY